MIPIFILQTWLLGLVSLGVVGGAVYLAYEWQQRSWGWDPVLKQWVFSPNFGSNEETTVFAVAIILTLIALAGGTIVKGILRLTSRGKGDADADPRTAPNATSQQRLRRPDGSELQIEFYGPEDGTPIVLTHGWGLDSREWNYLKRDLSDRFRLIVFFFLIIRRPPRSTQGTTLFPYTTLFRSVLLNLQAQKRFGYRRDELLGQKVTNIIPEGFAERLIADGLRSAEDALAQQIGTGIELQGRRKDRSTFPIELMLSPLGSAEGTLVTAAIRDISARKKAEAHLLQKMEELNRSNEELGKFAYIASHDLQEPLRMVASYTQLLSRRYKGKLDSDADEFIAFAVDGASRMQRLIQDLLAYSRVGTKGKDLLDISSETALQQALINLRGAIKDSGALVTHDPLPTVLADETQLIQLFQNLVGNAIKYQRPGIPKVHVTAAQDGDKKWMFSVQDNGLGIDPQYFERIFGMFQRLHKREEFAGTGIGLAICKKIVERHGGAISVESQLGKGSTFRFALAGTEAMP
jgi:PAS domain S-box-containing protein